MTHPRQLHKFGGSSLADPECYQRVAKILKVIPKVMIWWWSLRLAKPLTV